LKHELNWEYSALGDRIVQFPGHEVAPHEKWKQFAYPCIDAPIWKMLKLRQTGNSVGSIRPYSLYVFVCIEHYNVTC